MKQSSIEFLIAGLFDKGLITPNGETLKLIGVAKELYEIERIENINMGIQEFNDKVNQKIDSELAWCGGDRNRSNEMINWRKAYSNVRRWMEQLSKEGK